MPAPVVILGGLVIVFLLVRAALEVVLGSRLPGPSSRR
jgi:hypothetical protein